MSDKNRDILSDAIGRNSAMVLSLPSAGMLRHHKSRFLNETDDGLWIESVPAEHVLIDDLIAGGKQCAVSFKSGDQKVSFVAKVLRVDPEYRVNADMTVCAVLLERPPQVKAVQRRNAYRARVREDSELSVQVWRIPEHVRVKDKPPRAVELALTVRDLSVGGVGVIVLPQGDQPPKVLPGERVRVQIRFKDGEPCVVEGRMRTPRQAPAAAGDKPQPIQTGVQFQGLESGLEGRQMLTELTKIVSALHLEEVRRHRMGIA
ncbi:MAG TPA: PilZ domain-containing protein [Tepidisphaeraceae bacterium]|nr:PilZ domain-containing protein [Tepidisphaeraceae bacterium]